MLNSTCRPCKRPLHRLQAQREAEDVALQRLKQRVQEEFLKPLPAYTAEQGSLPTWGWVTTTE